MLLLSQPFLLSFSWCDGMCDVNRPVSRYSQTIRLQFNQLLNWNISIDRWEEREIVCVCSLTLDRSFFLYFPSDFSKILSKYWNNFEDIFECFLRAEEESEMIDTIQQTHHSIRTNNLTHQDVRLLCKRQKQPARDRQRDRVNIRWKDKKTYCWTSWDCIPVPSHNSRINNLTSWYSSVPFLSIS